MIAETETKIGVMTVSMAVMELDLTESQTIVFRNAAHGGLSVVYRRPDGPKCSTLRASQMAVTTKDLICPSASNSGRIWIELNLSLIHI